MAAVLSMVDADWSIVRSTGAIRYIGDDHTLSGGSPSYGTVIEFHRWVQAFADNEAYDSGGADTDNIEVDIINKDPTARSTDNIVTLNDYTASGGVKYNVDATAIEHLYDGTIVQGSGPTQERWDGIVNFGQPSAHIQILQNGAIIADDYWNYGHEAGSVTSAPSPTVMTDSTLGATTNEFIGYTILNVTDGSRGIIVSNTATTVTVSELYGGTLNTWAAANVHHIAVPIGADAAQGISHRFMVKTRDFGVDIDRRRLIGTTRRYGNTYGEFKINGTSQGNNVLALNDTGDLNNTTSWATIDALVDITNTEGLRLLDIAGDGTANEEYYSEWTRGANTINIFYERMKLSSADATAITLQGESGELHRGVTVSVPYDLETGLPVTATNDKHVYGTLVDHGVVTGGPFTVGEAVHEDTAVPVWKGRVLGVDGTGTTLVVDIESGTVGNTEGFTGQSSGATATTSLAGVVQLAAGELKVLAFDDQGAAGTFYGQITKGITPVDNTIVYDATDHTDSYTLSAAGTDRPVSTPFVGASTGSALIGAYGLGLVAADTGVADTYFDLANSPVNPPNNVTFTVSGFISGDYVLCTEDNATDINFGQMVTTGAAITGAAVTQIPVVAIPADTPSTAGTKGGIRIQRDSGLYSLHRYTALDLGTDIFTIPSFNFSTDNVASGNNVFVSYLDLSTVLTSENFAYVYSSDRTHFVRVRDGGASPIKNAEATGVMTSTGGVASVNRIDDI